MSIRYHVVIDKQAMEDLQNCKKEYLNLHKEFKNVPISNNKMIHELIRFWRNG